MGVDGHHEHLASIPNNCDFDPNGIDHCKFTRKAPSKKTRNA